jgi:4-amino-4-deoxychorismate lyase
MSPPRPLAVAVAGRGLVDPDEPVVHADDLGLLRGQAVFETVRVYGGRPFALDEHLERLARSAERVGIGPPDGEALGDLVEVVVRAGGRPDCSLRLTLTGGREGHASAVAIAAVSALPTDLEAARDRGIGLVALSLGLEPRARAAAPWLLAGVKSTSYAVHMAAWAEARRRGADDALLLAADGTVLECPVTNIWWRRGGELFTPSLDLGILAGVTRGRLLRLAGSVGYTVIEGCFPLRDVARADEAFTSSSIREVMPVVELDGRPIGDGRPGPASTALQRALRATAETSPEATS